MRLFVTGADGQLGHAVAEVFEKEKLYLGRIEKDDITSPEIVKKIREFKPDVILHAAAMTDVDGCELNPDKATAVNQEGTRNIASAARETGAKMVYISTDYVFDGTQKKPYRETDIVHPINVYGMSKLGGEKAVQELPTPWLIVRTSWVYGFRRANFVTNVLLWAKSQPPLRLVKDKTGSPTYTFDLARALKHLIEKECTGTYHAAGEGSCTWLEFGNAVLEIRKIEKEVVPILSAELKQAAKRPDQSVLDNGKLAQSGFTMRDWRVALRDYLRCF